MDLKVCFQMLQDIRKSLFPITEKDSIIDEHDEHGELLIYFLFMLKSEEDEISDFMSVMPASGRISFSTTYILEFPCPK